MRIIRVLSLIFGVFLPVFSMTAGAQRSEGRNAPFTLEITANLQEGHTNRWDFANTADKVINAGSMVVVAVRKTNNSDHEVKKMSQGGGVFGYQYEVRDSAGNLIAPKPRDHNAPILLGGPGRVVGSKDTLSPGESNLKGVTLSDSFDMGKPVTYTIQVWEHSADDASSAVVRSNTIRIKVLPPGDSSPPQK
jgi:hypothetical protein